MIKARAIIVDDEQRARSVLKSLVSMNSEELEIIGEADSVQSAIQLIEINTPEIIFLDINMPGLYGYELLNKIPHHNFQVIFITAYDSYAIKAFELNACDYLVKPIDRLRLSLAIGKALEAIRVKKQSQDYNKLIEEIENQRLQKIVIPELNRNRVVSLNEIVAVEASGSYSKIHFSESREITLSRNLKNFEANLPSLNNFFRSHKSWLINVDHVRDVILGDSEIILTNSVKAKLSRFKKSEFMTLLNV